MKRIILSFFLALILTSFQAFPQEIIPNSLVLKFDRILENPIQLKKFQPDNYTSENSIVLNCELGKYQIQEDKLLTTVTTLPIREVKYVFTQYRKADTYNQLLLNRQRLYQLYKIHPEIFNTRKVKWKVFVQKGPSTEVEAQSSFHGFVLCYSDVAKLASIHEGIKHIDSVLKKGDHLISKGVPEELVYKNVLTDNTITEVMKRNPSWENMLICCDLTGSMAPYASQIFLWHKLNMKSQRVKNFVFFNDGDDKSDSEKKLGKVGGLYYATAQTYESMITSAYSCMINGDGGDIEENDVEALKYGISKCTDCQDIVLIADNWANMRDFSMVRKIKKPVRIILCGTYNGVNIEYLDLARATGGSLHTIEEDIENLKSLNEGEEITVSGIKYKIEKGRFVQVIKI